MSKVRIKICGITNEADARLATSLGVDAVGLNFYPASPRFLAADRVEAILDSLGPQVRPVALFVNEPLAKATAFLERWPRLRTIQWHGDQPPVDTVTGFDYWPAFAIRDQGCLLRIQAFLEASQPQVILVDGHDPKQFGGTGQRAPWKLLATFRPTASMLLAGGLTPDNVAVAIQTVRPWGVDVASGVEAQPGLKDADKMRRFVEACREA